MKDVLSLLSITIFLVGSAMAQPRGIVFSNGIVSFPTTDANGWCFPRAGGYAECYDNQEAKGQPTSRISLDPVASYRQWTLEKTNMSLNDVNEICNKARIYFNAEEKECEKLLSIHLGWLGRSDEALKLGLNNKESVALKAREAEIARQKDRDQQFANGLINGVSSNDNHPAVATPQTNYNVNNNQNSYQQEQLRIQREQLEIQRQQLAQEKERLESEERRDSYNRAINSLQNLGNQMSQGYQRPSYDALDMMNAQKQQKRDNQTNYQLRQINNNLNGIRYGY